jgi:hypothetical protein
MSKHITTHRSLPSRGPCEATVIYITGDAGTGKTMIQDALRYVPNIRPLFMGSTNVSGMELRKVFTEHQLFANDHTVYSTTFQYLGRITPKVWGECMKRLYENTPPGVQTASYANPADFYEAIWPSLRMVCRQIFHRQHKESSVITPEAYLMFRRVIAETLPAGTPRDNRREHTMAMEQILAVYSRKNIPDQLIFDAFVHDEAGRLTCSWYIINVGMFYAVHEMYDTGVDKPVEIIVGSCTQQTSINSECIQGCADPCAHEPLKINDASMITMLTKPCLLYDGGIFVKNNKHMRRTKAGDPVRSANLAIFRNCLETSEPIPTDVIRFMRTEMSVTREQYLSKKCIHLCGTHEECRKVLNADDVAPEDTVLCEETMTAKGINWPDSLYGCTDNAGAMFKSANYSNVTWTKAVVNEPYSMLAKFKFGLLPKKDEPMKSKKQNPLKYSEWSNTRKFYKNRPYKTTHTTRCVLRSITGSWGGFLKDLAGMEDAMEDNPGLVSELVSAMASTLMYSNVGDEDVVKSIYGRTVTKMASIEELLQTLHDLRSLMAANAAEGHSDIFYTCTAEEKPKLVVTKGEHVYFLGRDGRSLRSPCSVRVGNTINVTMYTTCTRIDQSAGSYRSTKTAPKWQHRQKGTKRKANGTMIEEEEDEEVVNNDFSDDDDDDKLVKKQNLARESAILMDSEEALDGNDGGEFTVLDLIPLKLSLVSTVAASQGSTINGIVYGEVRKKMSASDLIVMSTRSANADDLSLYFADSDGKPADDPEKAICIIPLDQLTQDTIKILNVRSLRDTGVL